MDENYPWREAFMMAMLEFDPAKLQANLQSAQRAISERMKELAADHNGTPEEREAISDALNSLRVLQRELNGRNHDTSIAS